MPSPPRRLSTMLERVRGRVASLLRRGDTALIEAARSRDVRIVELLLDRGAHAHRSAQHAPSASRPPQSSGHSSVLGGLRS
eukprot:6185767-Pleurochrysis_carterae.AAC.1